MPDNPPEEHFPYEAKITATIVKSGVTIDHEYRLPISQHDLTRPETSWSFWMFPEELSAMRCLQITIYASPQTPVNFSIKPPTQE